MIMKQKSILPLAITVAILGGLLIFGRSPKNLAMADDYHGRVEQFINAIPDVIGQWHGTDIELPPAALALLRPNATCSRMYVNPNTGTVVDFLLVQCRTARDMLGHYPPICYKSNGWQLRSSTEQVWHADGLDAQAMEYEFVKTFPTRTDRIVVGNVLILPDGRFVRDMDIVRAMAGDHVKQAFGAAQMQVRIRGNMDMTPEQRSSIYIQFLNEIRDVILEIAGGVEL